MEVAVFAELLAQPRLSIIASSPTTRSPGSATSSSTSRTSKVATSSRPPGTLLVRAPPTPKTLDLIGHSSAGKSLLVFGDWVIDASSPDRHRVLPRTCRPGRPAASRYPFGPPPRVRDGRHGPGTLDDLHAREHPWCSGLRHEGPDLSVHYDAVGFAAEREYLLVSSRDLECAPSIHACPFDRGTSPLPRRRCAAEHDTSHAAPVADAPGERERGEPAALVRRQHGSELPGLLSVPACEIMFPSGSRGVPPPAGVAGWRVRPGVSGWHRRAGPALPGRRSVRAEAPDRAVASR